MSRCEGELKVHSPDYRQHFNQSANNIKQSSMLSVSCLTWLIETMFIKHLHCRRTRFVDFSNQHTLNTFITI
jgi:hypothetical protein